MPQNYGCCLCRPPSCLKRFVNVAFQLSVSAWGPSCKCLLVVLIANGMRPAKQVWADSLSCTSIVHHPVQYVRQSKQQSNIRRYGESGSVNLHKIEHLRSKNGFCSSIFQEFYYSIFILLLHTHRLHIDRLGSFYCIDIFSSLDFLKCIYKYGGHISAFHLYTLTLNISWWAILSLPALPALTVHNFHFIVAAHNNNKS